MKLVPLNCNACGAPLRVAESARFATCSHCHAQLAIHHEGGAVFTEVLARIAARTESIESEIQALRAELDLERLDKSWEKNRREILGSSGETTEPHWIVAMGCVAFCLGILLFLHGLFAPRGQIAPGLILIGMSVVFVLYGLGRVAYFEEAQRLYTSTRQRILGRGKRQPEMAREERSA
ncbi:hypothetical protein Pan44_36860 [Caulifigura coniformis]|uniref:Uncharacterized protein n=1 Tax=Caulifigura coniformis TaxID=2527983 RepID=A0A517SHN1_9PLAN|nr:hypothetical protein [Caulifigura coniformis]QDT55640.1 hypothetical protein Pan44_36860 [Caulifigura coniformis]